MNKEYLENNDNEPFVRLVDKIKQEVDSLEKSIGHKPTFSEYVESLIDVGAISTNKLKEDLRVLALGWSGAKLGKSNWRNLYNELQNQSLETDKKITKEDDKMEKNKILNFIEGLGIELDETIVKGIRNIGVLKLVIGISGFLLLRFLVSYFGSDDNVFTFYFYSAIGLVLFLSWYMSELKEGAKILSVLRFLGAILALVISLIVIVALLYGIIQYLIEAFEYLYQLFS